MRLIDADALRAEWLWEIGEYTANEILDSIDDMPTVTPEMSAVEFARAELRFNEMCGSTECKECEFGSTCKQFSTWVEPEIRVKFLQKWAQEHPERSEE